MKNIQIYESWMEYRGGLDSFRAGKKYAKEKKEGLNPGDFTGDADFKADMLEFLKENGVCSPLQLKMVQELGLSKAEIRELIAASEGSIQNLKDYLGHVENKELRAMGTDETEARQGIPQIENCIKELKRML